MSIGITMLHHTIYRQSGHVWVDDMDPVWIITMTLFESYNTIQFINHLSHIVIVPSGTYRHDIR